MAISAGGIRDQLGSGDLFEAEEEACFTLLTAA